MDGDEARRIERLEREDLVLFVNACFACTGQREFYGDRAGQQVSVDFLHRYTLGNYRRLYARCLALGLNHFNRAMIVGNLLAAGAPADAAQRAEENALLTAALAQLPPQRVHRLFAALAADRVNNRRTRAVMRRYLLEVRDLHFDAVKYRRRVRVAVRHAHVGLDEETSRFLGGGRVRSVTRPGSRYRCSGRTWRLGIPPRRCSGCRSRWPKGWPPGRGCRPNNCCVGVSGR